MQRRIQLWFTPSRIDLLMDEWETLRFKDIFKKRALKSCVNASFLADVYSHIEKHNQPVDRLFIHPAYLPRFEDVLWENHIWGAEVIPMLELDTYVIAECEAAKLRVVVELC